MFGDITSIYDDEEEDHFIMCEVCDIKLRGETLYKIHLTQSQHQKREEALADAGKIPRPKRLPHWTGLSYYLDYLQLDEPLIGLNHLLELDRTSSGLRYLCRLCSLEADLPGIASHIVGRKHRQKYLVTHRPDLVTWESENVPQLGKLVRAKAEVVERQNGRGIPEERQRWHREAKDRDVRKGSGPGKGMSDRRNPSPHAYPKASDKLSSGFGRWEKRKERKERESRDDDYPTHDSIGGSYSGREQRDRSYSEDRPYGRGHVEDRCRPVSTKRYPEEDPYQRERAAVGLRDRRDGDPDGRKTGYHQEEERKGGYDWPYPAAHAETSREWSLSDIYDSGDRRGTEYEHKRYRERRSYSREPPAGSGYSTHAEDVPRKQMRMEEQQPRYQAESRGSGKQKDMLDILKNIEIENVEEANFIKDKLCSLLKDFQASKSERALAAAKPCAVFKDYNHESKGFVGSSYPAYSEDSSRADDYRISRRDAYQAEPAHPYYSKERHDAYPASPEEYAHRYPAQRDSQGKYRRAQEEGEQQRVAPRSPEYYSEPAEHRGVYARGSVSQQAELYRDPPSLYHHDPYEDDASHQRALEVSHHQHPAHPQVSYPERGERSPYHSEGSHQRELHYRYTSAAELHTSYSQHQYNTLEPEAYGPPSSALNKITSTLLQLVASKSSF